MPRRIFSPEDQIAFARISGDWNPMHMDEVAARRLLFGTTVVHGVHAMLWALDQFSAQNRFLALAGISAAFDRPIPVGSDVDLTWNIQADGTAEASISCAGVRAVRLVVKFGAPVEDKTTIATVLERPQCHEYSIEELKGVEGTVPLALPKECSLLFPALSERLPASQLASLLATTRIVGMEAPGLHSVFNRLGVEFSAAVTSAEISYRVTRADTRFGLVELAISGPGVVGTIGGLVRPKPVSQPEAAAVAAMVAPGEFANISALVVGGSRGMGEVAAKIIAAGGGHCALTYATGRLDAERVCDDIRSNGGTADIIQMDITSEASVKSAMSQISHVNYMLYFSSPKIFRRKSVEFDALALDEFIAHYVRGFAACVTHLKARACDGLSIFYPSSVAVSDPVPALMEYAAAKGAGEVAARYLEAESKGVRMTIRRLPRIATDQTATVPPAKASDSLPILLAILREMKAS